MSNCCVLQDGEIIDFPVEWFNEIVEQLREWRLNMARIVALPPYCIFNDKVMNNLAYVLPRQKELLWLVSGFNQTLIETHGKEIVEIIDNFLTKKNVVEILYGSFSFDLGNQRIRGILGYLGLLSSVDKK